MKHNQAKPSKLTDISIDDLHDMCTLQRAAIARKALDQLQKLDKGRTNNDVRRKQDQLRSLLSSVAIVSSQMDRSCR